MSNLSDRPISPSSTPDLPPQPSKLPSRITVSLQAFWEGTRTRILVWYVLILTFASGISVPLFRYQLFADIDARVRREMLEERDEFRRLLADQSRLENPEPEERETNETGIDNWISISENDATRQPIQLMSHKKLDFRTPKTEVELRQFFDAYMAYRLPEDETYLIAFVGGQFYKSSPPGRPDDLNENALLMQRWARQDQIEQGEQSSENVDVGTILYLVEPIRDRDQLFGVFVIAHSTAGERAEGLAATWLVARITLSVLVVALVLVWVAAGRVLRPLQTLANTVEAIGESDLTQRLSVRGKGELARLAAQFNDMMNRLETAFVSQKSFISDAGHELRTPITIIRGHLELMDVESAEQQETLALVTDELDRMSRFVDDMILLAKAERPDFLQFETIDATTLTQELFAKAQALAVRNWELEEVAQGQITVDRQRITQAMMNLAQNATQHTQPTDTITLGSAIGRGKIHFWVRDTGTGIALTDQKRIFERFARATHQRRRSEGAGLGLSIVRAIAVAHNGDVTLRSQIGEGSTFAIVLPLQGFNQGAAIQQSGVTESL